MDNRAEIERRVLEVISPILGIDVEDLDGTVAMYRTPGWDSLATLEIVSAVETEFKVAIDDDNASDCTSLAGLMKVLADVDKEWK